MGEKRREWKGEERRGGKNKGGSREKLSTTIIAEHIQFYQHFIINKPQKERKHSNRIGREFFRTNFRLTGFLALLFQFVLLPSSPLPFFPGSSLSFAVFLLSFLPPFPSSFSYSPLHLVLRALVDHVVYCKTSSKVILNFFDLHQLKFPSQIGLFPLRRLPLTSKNVSS